jgi:hypothetical protein
MAEDISLSPLVPALALPSLTPEQTLPMGQTRDECRLEQWLPRPWWNPWLLCALVMSSGCYRYQARGPAPSFNYVGVDENAPRSSIRWSTFWGGHRDVWQPIGCVHADRSTHIVSGEKDPECIGYYQVCEHGAGRVDVDLLVYSVPLALVTLGMVMPVEATIYCATTPPSGPRGPTGPVGPTGANGPSDSSQPCATCGASDAGTSN